MRLAVKGRRGRDRVVAAVAAVVAVVAVAAVRNRRRRWGWAATLTHAITRSRTHSLTHLGEGHVAEEALELKGDALVLGPILGLVMVEVVRLA